MTKPDVAAAADAAAKALENAKDTPQDEITSAAPTVSLLSLLVIITTDSMSKVPQRVFEYEIPVLMALHGEDKIDVIADSDEEVDLEVSEAGEVYDQLCRKYGDKGHEKVRQVYPTVGAFAEEVGLDVRRARVRGSRFVREQAQSLSVDHKKTPAKSTPTNAERLQGRAQARATGGKGKASR